MQFFVDAEIQINGKRCINKKTILMAEKKK
jgi:hypothetical protein